MSPQSQYVIGLYRDVNPTKNQCRHNIGCPLGIEVNRNRGTSGNTLSEAPKIDARGICVPLTDWLI